MYIDNCVNVSSACEIHNVRPIYLHTLLDPSPSTFPHPSSISPYHPSSFPSPPLLLFLNLNKEYNSYDYVHCDTAELCMRSSGCMDTRIRTSYYGSCSPPPSGPHMLAPSLWSAHARPLPPLMLAPSLLSGPLRLWSAQHPVCAAHAGGGEALQPHGQREHHHDEGAAQHEHLQAGGRGRAPLHEPHQ